MHFHSRSFVDLVVSLLECCVAISGLLKFCHWLQLHARFSLISSCILAEAKRLRDGGRAFYCMDCPFVLRSFSAYIDATWDDPMTESCLTKLLILALEFLIQSLELRVHFVLGVEGRLTGRACSRRSAYPAFAELRGPPRARSHLMRSFPPPKYTKIHLLTIS